MIFTWENVNHKSLLISNYVSHFLEDYNSKEAEFTILRKSLWINRQTLAIVDAPMYKHEDEEFSKILSKMDALIVLFDSKDAEFWGRTSKWMRAHKNLILSMPTVFWAISTTSSKIDEMSRVRMSTLSSNFSMDYREINVLNYREVSDLFSWLISTVTHNSSFIDKCRFLQSFNLT